MAQKGLMRILSRKDGKSMVSNDKDNEKAKLTRILEFVPARKPEQAKIGSIVRFMYNPGDGQSAYWLQGTLGPRLDKYKVAQKSGFKRNRFTATKLAVVKCWGENGVISETVTVNLSKTTAWSLGEEIELETTEEDEAFVFEQKEKCDTEDEVDETAEDSEADEKDEVSNRVKITPSMNESDTESLKRIKINNNSNNEDTSTVISTISDDISGVRRLRTSNISDWLTDKRA